MIEYINFDLEISSNEDKTVSLRVVSSPEGEHPTVIRPNPQTQLWYRLVENFHRPGVRAELIHETGSELWEYLLPPTIEGLFRQSLAAAEVQKKRLRVRLRHEKLDLVNVPWECAFDPILNDHVALAFNYSVVRYLALPKPVVMPNFDPSPLRLLAIGASPKDTDPQLNVQDEVDAITALSSEEFVVYGRSHGTWFDVRRGMNRNPHVFHFCGHCDWSEPRGAFLYLETDDGKTDLVDVRKLARQLRGKNVQIVVLNACVTAIGDDTTTEPIIQNPWNRVGFAQGLIREGIPAVIATLSYSLDTAAIEFAKNLYENLAKNVALEESLFAARRAIADDKYANWALPVLYLRHTEAANQGQFTREQESIIQPVNVHIEETTNILGCGVQVGKNSTIGSVSINDERD